ncbi:MAG: hypothetical protein LKJ69_07620 [Lactobacillus sp.]|nr:hypothetical protein [Lactobacillus sp.]
MILLIVDHWLDGHK